MLKMDLEYEKGILFVRLNGVLNNKSSYKINNYIIPVINKHNLKKVIFNLKDLKSLDTSGIYSILNTKCTMKKNKGQMYLCALSKEIELKLKHLHIKTKSSEQEILKLIEV